MQPIEDILRERFNLAIGLAFGTENVIDPLIKTADPKFADYQSNVAMPLSKKVSLPPREVATQILKRLDLADLCEPLTEKSIAGPGFINLRLKRDFLAHALTQAFPPTAPGQSPRAGVDRTASPQTIVIDYSGPNIAKAMHVGHLRSTVIGDTFARTLEFLGHTVVRQNHLGDYGTQFGMLIAYLRTKNLTTSPLTLADLGKYYKEASAQFKIDPAFANTARQAVVELQSGAPEAVALWQRMKEEGRKHYTEIYRLLSITLTTADERGESFYGPRLAPMVDRLKAALELGGEGGSPSSRSGKPSKSWEVNTNDLPEPDAAEAAGALASDDSVKRVGDVGQPAIVDKPFAAVSDGTLCVFLPGYITREKEPLPLMIQKSDGGFGYDATDLAAVYFRIQDSKNTPAEQAPLSHDWHADRIIIATDSRQKQHLAMIFDAARATKWDINPTAGQHASLEHAAFGSILGDDGKPMKTREGDNVPLLNLLQEAVQRAHQAVEAKNPDLSPEARQTVARAVGLGAIKYADLRQDRNLDYVFNWDRMLSFEGNTGPYLQYAYTRVQSIFRKSGISPDSVADARLSFDEPQELALAKKLLQFGSVVESVARDLKPHYLTSYLFDLATLFSSFYENCPVLKAPTEDLKRSRLALSRMVAQTLHLGLTQLLGIQTLEEM